MNNHYSISTYSGYLQCVAFALALFLATPGVSGAATLIVDGKIIALSAVQISYKCIGEELSQNRIDRVNESLTEIESLRTRVEQLGQQYQQQIDSIQQQFSTSPSGYNMDEALKTTLSQQQAVQTLNAMLKQREQLYTQIKTKAAEFQREKEELTSMEDRCLSFDS